MISTVFVPVNEIDPKLLPETQNYIPRYDENGVFVGLGKTGKDSYIRGFVCDVDENGQIVKVRYDALKKFLGPIVNGHGTPGAVMVVAEKRADGYYLYTGEEMRIFIYDHVNHHQGAAVRGFPGGFTEPGKSPQETALKEALEELGIHVQNASVVRIGYAADDRAMTDTCNEYYLGLFERQGEQKLGADEVIGNKKVVRVDQFVPGLDGIIDTAYAFLVHHLGLVKPM